LVIAPPVTAIIVIIITNVAINTITQIIDNKVSTNENITKICENFVKLVFNPKERIKAIIDKTMYGTTHIHRIAAQMFCHHESLSPDFSVNNKIDKNPIINKDNIKLISKIVR
jgi:hypothetical protein